MQPAMSNEHSGKADGLHKLISDTKASSLKQETVTTNFEDFDFGFHAAKNRCNNDIETSPLTDRNSPPVQFNCSMEGEHRQPQLAAAYSTSAHVKPLHLRKTSSHAVLARSHQPHDSSQNVIEKPVYPPRTTSIRNHPTYCDPSLAQSDATQTKTPSPPLDTDQSSNTPESLGKIYPTINGNSMQNSTDQPVISSNKSRHLYPAIVDNNSRCHSSEIMGDFVPIDSPNMAGLQPGMDPNDDRLQG